MIEDNIIKFGYGTILVESNSFCKILIIKHIQPPVEIGNYLTEKEEKDLELIQNIEFRYATDMKILYQQLLELEQYNYRLLFRGYVLDFTNYNPKSVDVFKKGLKKVIDGWIMALAA